MPLVSSRLSLHDFAPNSDPQLHHRTSLESQRVSQLYRSRCEKCAEMFFLWCRRRSRPIDNALEDPTLMAALLAHYVQAHRDSGGALWEARCSILGVQLLKPAFRHHLRRAWDGIESWQFLVPSQNRVPVPLRIVDGLAITLAVQGCKHTPLAALYWLAAVLVRMAFHGLMRPGEALNLRFGDLLVTDSAHAPLVVAIRDPKNKSSMGRYQHRTIQCPGTAAWAAWISKDRHVDDYIWPASAEKFRAFWDWALNALGAADLRLLPSGLRGGGATHLLMSGVDVAHIKYRGAWASEKNLAIYLQEGMATMVWAALPAHVATRIVALLLRDSQLLASPPPCKWQALFTAPPHRRTRSSSPSLTQSNYSVSSGPAIAKAARLKELSRRDQSC